MAAAVMAGMAVMLLGVASVKGPGAGFVSEGAALLLWSWSGEVGCFDGCLVYLVDLRAQESKGQVCTAVQGYHVPPGSLWVGQPAL